MQRILIGTALGVGLTALVPMLAPAQSALSLAPADDALRLTVTAALLHQAYPGKPQATRTALPSPTPDYSTGLPLALQLSTTLAGADAMAAAQTMPRIPAQVALIEQARFWYSQGRDDLASAAVVKLLRMAPEHLQGLEMLARIRMRQRQPQAVAQLLQRMRRQGDTVEIRRVQALLRIDTDDREALRAIRLQSRAGNDDAAAAAMLALYPEGPPTEEMTLEYWRLVANGRNGRARARSGLQELIRTEPENLRYQLALDELLTARMPVDRAALARIIAATDNPAYAKQARAAWRRALLNLDDSAANSALLRAYLLQEKNDSAVAARLAQMNSGVDRRQRLLADPVYQARSAGLALLAAGNLEAAQAPLQRAFASRGVDVDVISGLGLVRLRQKRHAESETLFRRAAELDPARRARWLRMAGIARYWGLITLAGVDVDADRLALAEQRLREARSIDPSEPAAMLALARLFVTQARNLDAEGAYRAVLVLAPANQDALAGLVQLYLARADDAAADTLLAAQQPAVRAALLPAISDARATRLRTQADARTAAGDSAAAIALLEQAAPLAPADPWLRFDLGKLYARRNGPGDGARADALFTALLARTPTDDAALYAYALLDDSRDRPQQALATLEKIPTDLRARKIAQLQRRMWVTLQTQRGAALAAAGNPSRATEVLAEAATAIGSDLDLAPPVAQALAAVGTPTALDAARALLQRVDQAQPHNPEWRVQRAEIIAGFNDDAALAQAIAAAPALPTTVALDGRQSARLSTLRETLLARRAEVLARSGDQAGALALLDADSTVPNSRRLRLLRADTELALQRYGAAETHYRALLQTDPNDDDAGIGLIDTLIATGEAEQARILIGRQLAQRQAQPQGLSADQAASLSGRLIDLQEDAAAMAIVTPALATAPGNTRLLNQAAQLAERDNRPEQAIEYLRRSIASSSGAYPRGSTTAPASTSGAAPSPASVSNTAPTSSAPDSVQRPGAGLLTSLQIDAPATTDSTSASTYRRLAELLDARSTWLAGAVDVRSRSGTAGLSDYRYSETPLEVRMPWRDGSRVFAQAALVRSSAGTLDLAATGPASRFGSVLLCQPGCNSGTLAQNVNGLGVAAGIERGDVRADIGVTPLGFPIQSIVGGVLKKGDIAGFSYSIDVSRRAVTGSVLSYAGARDPRSGELWGGVTANGIRLGLSRDSGGSVGAWSAFSMHRLSGRNVQSNDRTQLMGGTYWRVINEDDRLFTVGVNAMLWRFSENAGEYTFGHGGYYSPQRYTSLALPVSFGQRFARLSYTVRAAVSASRSSTAAADYFPTRPDLQAQADALAPQTGTDAHYGAGTGRGIGRSLSAAFEYQLQPQLFIGGRFEIDRSTDYAPNRALFYFRYNLDRDSARPVVFPPEPLVPVSQY